MSTENSNNESINTFEKGLDMDSNYQNIQSGSYVYAENLINNSEEGKFVLTPENGIVQSNTQESLTTTPNANLVGSTIENPSNWITIGSVYIDDIEILFQGFLATNDTKFTNSRIATKNIFNGNFKVIYVNHQKLNFNIDYHINSPQANKIYNGDINLYFTDFFNPPRFLRLVYNSDLTTTDPYIVNQDVANLTLDFEEPIIDFISQGSTGGNAPVGTIHLFLQYVDKYGNTTRYSNITNGIPFVKDNRVSSLKSDFLISNTFKGNTGFTKSIPNGKLNGGNILDTRTSKTLSIHLNHLDTSYAYYKIGYIYYKESAYTPDYFLIDVLNPIDKSNNLFKDNILKTITFNEPTVDLDINEITQIAKKFEYTHAKTMTQHQNYLLLGNLKNEYEATSDAIYETFFEKITVKTGIKSLTSDLSIYNSSVKGKAYDHEQSTFRYKSYKRAEVYSLGARLIFKGGYKTKVFHIPAKEKIREYNSGLRYILPTKNSSITGTYYSEEEYKSDSKYIKTSNNKKIRHHVMPDFYHIDANNNTYYLSDESFVSNNKTTVNAMGIYFENLDFSIFSDIIKDQIAGIEFVRQTRENLNNKRILCQGITRLVQRPLINVPNFPVVSDINTGLKPFQDEVESKNYPFAGIGYIYNNSSSGGTFYNDQIEQEHGESFFSDFNNPEKYFRWDGLDNNQPLGNKYSTLGKHSYFDSASSFLFNVNSLTSSLPSFGTVTKSGNIQENSTSNAINPYLHFGEAIVNIISPETEFNLITIPSTVKLELRQKLYFNTYQIASDLRTFNGTINVGGVLDKINNNLLNNTDTNLGNYEWGGGSNGDIRSLDKRTYYDFNLGNGGENVSRILQISRNFNTSFLVAEPSLNFVNNTNVSNFRFLSEPLSTVFDDLGKLPSKQSIIDLNQNTLTYHAINDGSANANTFKFLIKHSFMNNGLYLVPSQLNYTVLENIFRKFVNNNIRYDLRLISDPNQFDQYYVTQNLGNARLNFADIKAPVRYFNKDYIQSTSSTKLYNLCTNEEKAEVDYSSTPVFDVIQDLTSQYGSIYTAEYFPISVNYLNSSTTNVGNNSNLLFSGDTFVSWYGNNNGGSGGAAYHQTQSTTTNSSFSDNALLHFILNYHTNVMYFPVETSINTHFRVNEGTTTVDYFPKTTFQEVFNDINKTIFKQSPHFNDDSYNLAFSKSQNNYNLSLSSNQLSTANTFGNYPNRIIYSNRSVSGEIDDKMRQFLTKNITDIPKDTGEIWNIYTMNNDIYAHTPNALWKTYMLQTTGVTTSNGDEFVLGQSQLFGLPAQKLLTKEGASGGTMSSWGNIMTPYGLIFIDNNGNKVFRVVNDQLEELSTSTLMMNFFSQNTKFATKRGNYKEKTHYLDDTPYNPLGHGFHFGWDDFNKRVLITKRSGVNTTLESKSYSMRFKNDKNEFFREFTLSFSFLNNRFISFNTYLPLYYINSGNYLMSIPDPLKQNLITNKTNFIGYHSDHTNPCKFYNLYPDNSKLSYVNNTYPMYEKVFDNIVLDMYNYRQIIESTNKNLVQSKTLIPNRGCGRINNICKDDLLDNLEVETSNQYSGEIQLIYNHNTEDHFKYYNDFRRGVKYYNKQYRISLPKSRTENVLIDRDNLKNYDKGIFGYEKLGDRFKDKYLKVTITWKNYEKFNFILNFIKNIFRINYK